VLGREGEREHRGGGGGGVVVVVQRWDHGHGADAELEEDCKKGWDGSTAGGGARTRAAVRPASAAIDRSLARVPRRRRPEPRGAGAYVCPLLHDCQARRTHARTHLLMVVAQLPPPTLPGIATPMD
jgi:hypothetical protein